MNAALPDLALLVEVADRGLAPAIRAAVDTPARRAALAEQLAWWLEVAARDMDHARGFHRQAPVAGAEDADYLDRWLVVSGDLWVLAGPRFRALDLALPFVGVTGASRPIVAADLPALRRFARERFRRFTPKYLTVWSGAPAGTWPGTRADMRLLAGRLGALRRRPVPPELTVGPLTDLSRYDGYAALYDQHAALAPEHRFQARPATREEFAAAVTAGAVWAVQVNGEDAGVVAAERGVAGGCRGAEVTELVLSRAFCGRGYGEHLSVLLARQLSAPDDQFLFGTIHIDNHPARRAALAAGREDIGGEVLIDL